MWMDDLMIKGFKDFLLRGNIVDLAVAVSSAPRSRRSLPRSRHRSSNR
jgi:hypothetical protein